MDGNLTRRTSPGVPLHPRLLQLAIDFQRGLKIARLGGGHRPLQHGVELRLLLPNLCRRLRIPKKHENEN
jgi:hypothetical protein